MAGTRAGRGRPGGGPEGARELPGQAGLRIPGGQGRPHLHAGHAQPVQRAGRGLAARTGEAGLGGVAGPRGVAGLLARSPVVAGPSRPAQLGPPCGERRGRGGGAHRHRCEQLGYGPGAVARRRPRGGGPQFHARRAPSPDQLARAVGHRAGVRGGGRAAARQDRPRGDRQHGGARRGEQVLVQGGRHAGACSASAEVERDPRVRAQGDAHARGEARSAGPDIAGGRDRGVTVPAAERGVRAPERPVRAVLELHRC